MTTTPSIRVRKAHFLNRLQERLAARAEASAAFASTPEPRMIGSFAKGRQLVGGTYLFAGHLVTAPGKSVWDVEAPAPVFTAALHGFAWLDDLAAVGDSAARQAASDWLTAWIERYGAGVGPGWAPELTGRRLIRWVNHALFLLQGQNADHSDVFFRSLNHQTRFLSKRWRSAAPGLPRFEALAGLIYANMALEGKEVAAKPAVKALARECAEHIDASGGIATRNPEDLLDLFTLLSWAAAALADGNSAIPLELVDAIDRVALTLRNLRHSDGGLARFHGGGRGLEGRLDHVLRNTNAKTDKPGDLRMGFARLSAGRTSLVIDAAAPPGGASSADAHASTLAFELTSDRYPVIVNCGSGTSFGPDWRCAGRATPSHSTLCLDGLSSARLGDSEKNESTEELVYVPEHVPTEIKTAPNGMRFQGGHDGYLLTHGATHARVLDLTSNGLSLAGEDMLLAIEDADKRLFDEAKEPYGAEGIPFDLRFHLHPEVDASLDLGGAAISIALKSGEIWVFRAEGVQARLKPSVYLETGRLIPRATQQIVLSGRAIDYATRIRWSLSKPQGSHTSRGAMK